jgi:hypothetical protein
MGVVRVAQLDDAFVIHFQSERERLNAYTLASTLVAIADAAKAANSALNPGYDIEVLVEAVGPGSFRAKIRAVYTKARNLFSDQRLQSVVLSIVASYIYERTLSVDNKIQVQVNTNEVVIVRGEDRVIVPRNVYDATRVVEKDPVFVRAVARSLEAPAKDQHVTGLGFVREMTSPPPEVVIPKEWMQQVAAIVPTEEPSSRVITEQCDLQIVKAILEKSRRKWEFSWRGVRITAPVLDERFYSDFFAHAITIAPGDALNVRLAIKQARDPNTGIYTNLSYEVIDVFNHIPGIRQMSLDSGSAAGDVTLEEQNGEY